MLNHTWDLFDDFILNRAKARSITLEKLQNQESFLKRYDTKYILDEKKIISTLNNLGREWHVLNVGNKIQINYKTLYFDTHDFRLFKDHKQGKRKRFKIRIRFYETGEIYLELKLKTNLEETLKFRWKCPTLPSESVIESPFKEVISQKLNEYLYQLDMATLEYKLSTEFTRTTLFNSATKEKLTIDKNFIVDNKNLTLPISKKMLILEIKSSKPLSSLNSTLNSLNIRSVSLSKYGAGAPALFSYLGRNPWVSTLKIFEG
jgi:hypothetical protein